VLKHLAINNIVLIDKAEINFSSGLCILSGETGSGKSILLDALGLAIGFRSNLRLIGNLENKALVTAEFDIKKNEICKNLLKENDLLNQESQNLLQIRRLIQENSSSKVYLNDQLIGVNLLAKIGESLVEIHGQHDQRGLLNSSFHCDILDQYSQNFDLLNELKKIYENLKIIDQKINDLEQKKEQAIREKDYLEYIINELESAKIKDNEEDELVNKKDLLSGKEKILNFLHSLKSHLLESNSQLFLGQKFITRNQNIINNYLTGKEEYFEEVNRKIDNNASEIEAIISKIEEEISQLENENENLSEIEERLFLVRSLMRKFSTNCQGLSVILQDATSKLFLLKNEQENNNQLKKEKEILLTEYQKCAVKISEKRKKSALILSQKVETELSFLKMANVGFKVEVSSENNQEEYREKGYDKVKFSAAINNNNFDDISKIASGGELSRFMLALKVALIDVMSIPTIIFDEIDTGIGGSTADAVGKRLKILSKNLQILVVTHQPQIAAKADSHFKISKINQENKIKTIIEELDLEKRKIEIARMLSGEEISQEALAAANKLISEGDE
jgi:DNA repair protein RecN (Recombination protein N)